MSIFKKGEASIKIKKKIDSFQAQLVQAEEKLQGKEQEIELAIGSGSSSDKLFNEAGSLKSSLEVRQSIITRLEEEYGSAQAGEARAERLAELAKFEKIFEKKFATLQGNLQSFIEDGKNLLAREDDITAEYYELFAIPVPEGVSAPRQLPVGFPRIIRALTVKMPVDSPVHAMELAARETTSLLAANGGDVLARIAMAKGVLNEEAEVAPAPDPEPVVAATPKKRLQIINGQPADVYLQRKREARAMRKATEPKAISRRALVEAAMESGNVVTTVDGVREESRRS